MNQAIKWHLEQVSVSDLKGYSKNPRLLTDAQMRQLRVSISKFGVIDRPFINLDNTIIGGHQRVEIMKLMGHETIDVMVPSRQLDHDEVEELNIRHNQNTGSWDYEILANQFDADKLMDWGFTASHLFDEAKDKPKGKSAKATLEFSSEAELGGALEHLEQLALDWGCKLKVKV
jgi:hypothetical protein